MDIREDLSSLKRHALQALCKKYGVKANGKNVFMISALERIRRENIQHSQNAELPTDNDEPAPVFSVCTSQPSPATVETKVPKKKTGRRGGSKRKTRSGSSIETTADLCGCGDSKPLPTEKPYSTLTSLPAKPTHPREPTPRKRKKRDTYSIASDSSFSSQQKIPRLSHLPDHTMHTTAENLSTPHNTTDVQPFSPPTEGICFSGSTKRKRVSTFVVEPSPVTVDRYSTCALVSPIVMSESVEDTRDDTVAAIDNNEAAEVVNNKRRRSQTVDLPSVTTERESGDDVMTEVLKMLDKKVEERKCAPDYKPVYSKIDISHSRLPVKTNTEKKFDKAHSRHFNTMKSIVSVADRKRKQSTGNVPSCAVKRPRLSEKGEKPKVRAPLSAKVSHNLPAKKDATKAVSNKVVFQPTITSTKKMNVQFSKSTNKHAESQLKTPKKASTMLHASAKKTPSKKAVYNLQASLKKKPSYQPYTGAVPKL